MLSFNIKQKPMVFGCMNRRFVAKGEQRSKYINFHEIRYLAKENVCFAFFAFTPVPLVTGGN